MKKLPVGLENFQEIQKSEFYYIDKTKLIEQILENWGKVNLFTRPRRFGKTLIGILKNNPSWAVKSNRESGDGFADILIKPKNPDAGIIIELRYAHSIHELDKACEILAYGIAFYKKRCKVVVEKL